MRKTDYFEPEGADTNTAELTPEKRFERFFVKMITGMATDKGLSQAEFGRRVFGEKSGIRIWGGVRSDKRCRDVSLAEALHMANVLDIEFPSLIWQAYERAKSEDILS